MSKKVLFMVSIIGLLLLVLPFLEACAKPAPAPTPAPAAKTITVRALRPFPIDNNMSSTYRRQIELGNQMGQGKVVFKDMGGAEVYATGQQLEAVKSGTIDFLNAPGSYGLSLFPEADAQWMTFGATAVQQRETGLIAAFDRMARKRIGVAILGAPSYYTFNVFTKKPVKSLADLKGLKIRSTPSYESVMKALGVATVSIPMGDLYTSLQTGVVDGACLPAMGNVGYALQEVLKYQIYPPFWNVDSHLIYVNAAWFDALPADVKNVIVNSVKKVDEESYDVFTKEAALEQPLLRKGGVQPIVFTDDEWWQVQKMQWEFAGARLRQLAPENAEELIKIAQQFYPPKKVVWPPYDWK